MKSENAALERVIRGVIDNSGGPYTLLGLLPTAGPEAVKNAHRGLAALLHPDRNPGNIGAAAAMAKVNEAYSLLTSPAAKRKHDVVSGYAKKCLCPVCAGTGLMRVMRGFKLHKTKCLDCRGTGKVVMKAGKI